MIDIPSYNTDEFTAILGCQQGLKRLPQDVDCDQILYHSGLVPRMIFFWCEAWHTRLDTPLDEIRDGTGGFYNRATEFYRGKIKKALERAENVDPQQRREIHDYAAAVATNMSLMEPPPQWKITGLFAPNSNAQTWTYVCPPVIKAFVRHMMESYKPSIDLLLADPNLRWRAFELLVILAFRPQKHHVVKFRSRSLSGEQKEWEITLTRAIEQTSFLKAIPVLEPGALVILKKGHSVVDLVAYSTKYELFFIQISTLSYGNHSSKVVDLDKSIAKRRPAIIKYYMSLCRTSDGKRLFKTKSLQLQLAERLPNGVHYLYITTSESPIKTPQKTYWCNHPVNLVTCDDLPLLMGRNWDLYKDNFIKS